MKTILGKMFCQDTLLTHKKATWPICYPSKRNMFMIDKLNEVTYSSGKTLGLRSLDDQTIKFGKPPLSKTLSLGALNGVKIIYPRAGRLAYLGVKE